MFFFYQNFVFMSYILSFKLTVVLGMIMQAALICLIVLSIAVVCCSVQDFEKLHSNTRDWCNYIKSTLEPKAIFYNRMGKCGSTSLSAVLDRQVNHTAQVTTLHMSNKYWKIDYYQNKVRAKMLLTQMKNALQSAEHVVLDGHWRFVHFNSTDGTKIENINLLRECKSRVISHLVYHMFDSSYATKAMADGTYNQLIFGEPLDTREDLVTVKASAVACLSNYSCIRNIPNLTEQFHDGSMVENSCGSQCAMEMDSTNRSLYDGAVRNILDPKQGYVLVGVLEEFPAYLKLLECVYPTIFRDAHALYSKDPIHYKASSAYTVTPAMLRLAQEVCRPQDSAFYDQVRTVFDRRYKAMKSHPHMCCRTTNDISDDTINA